MSDEKNEKKKLKQVWRVLISPGQRLLLFPVIFSEEKLVKGKTEQACLDRLVDALGLTGISDASSANNGAISLLPAREPAKVFELTYENVSFLLGHVLEKVSLSVPAYRGLKDIISTLQTALEGQEVADATGDDFDASKEDWTPPQA